MSPRRKPSAPSPGPEKPTMDRVAERLQALPAERQGAFLAWLEREHGKATKPVRGPGRPRLYDAPLTDSVTIKVTPTMRNEMRRMAKEHGLRNEADYLRALHEAFLAIAGLGRPATTKRRPTR